MQNRHLCTGYRCMKISRQQTIYICLFTKQLYYFIHYESSGISPFGSSTVTTVVLLNTVPTGLSDFFLSCHEYWLISTKGVFVWPSSGWEWSFRYFFEAAVNITICFSDGKHGPFPSDTKSLNQWDSTRWRWNWGLINESLIVTRSPAHLSSRSLSPTSAVSKHYSEAAAAVKISHCACLSDCKSWTTQVSRCSLCLWFCRDETFVRFESSVVRYRNTTTRSETAATPALTGHTDDVGVWVCKSEQHRSRTALTYRKCYWSVFWCTLSVPETFRRSCAGSF